MIIEKLADENFKIIMTQYELDNTYGAYVFTDTICPPRGPDPECEDNKIFNKMAEEMNPFWTGMDEILKEQTKNNDYYKNKRGKV